MSVFYAFSNIAISIHALLAESDRVLECTYNAHVDFYPRSPCGERLISDAPSSAPYAISIHALLAESDSRKYLVILGRVISIHALLAESDIAGPVPRRGRIISIHALLAESDGGPSG